MLTMNIKNARACLGKRVAKAEKGETVVILRHGKQSARLVAMPARPKALPNLRKFRAAIARSQPGLAATVILARQEERF